MRLRAIERLPSSLLARPFGLALRPLRQRFLRALEDPQASQERAWRRIQQELAPSQRGEQLGLSAAHTLHDLRRIVPLSVYDDYALDLARAQSGIPRVFTRSAIVRFERSGGSTGPQKLLPFTRPFLREMAQAFLPWLADLYAQPGVDCGCSYWSLSPLGSPAAPTSGGIAVGADDDTSWFPAFLQPLLARLLAAPSWLARLSDVDVCRYVTLRLLLEREDLTLISVWSPTFFTLLLQTFHTERERLLDDLATGRCRPPAATTREQELIDRWPFHALPARAQILVNAATARDLWPKLSLLSMWTEGSSAAFVPEAQRLLGDVPLQGKGLLATEGVISIPLGVSAGRTTPLAVAGHVFEFVDEQSRHVHFAWELERGKTYQVVLTTSAGLVRYCLGDRVEVTGFLGRTPTLRFLGRAHTSDLVGEKLANALVDAVLPPLLPPSTRFALLVPDDDARPPRYRLILETDAGDAACAAAARALDDKLSEGHPWRYARALGQLGAIDVARITDGARRYEAALLTRGTRAGDIKPSWLCTHKDLARLLAGHSTTPILVHDDPKASRHDDHVAHPR